jgi:hypothetical protein
MGSCAQGDAGVTSREFLPYVTGGDLRRTGRIRRFVVGGCESHITGRVVSAGIDLKWAICPPEAPPELASVTGDDL